MHLVTVEDSAEQAFLLNEIKKDGGEFVEKHCRGMKCVQITTLSDLLSAQHCSLVWMEDFSSAVLKTFTEYCCNEKL